MEAYALIGTGVLYQELGATAWVQNDVNGNPSERVVVSADVSWKRILGAGGLGSNAIVDFRMLVVTIDGRVLQNVPIMHEDASALELLGPLVGGVSFVEGSASVSTAEFTPPSGLYYIRFELRCDAEAGFLGTPVCDFQDGGWAEWTRLTVANLVS